ncbi:MAG: hypothetical protein KF796_09850 [Ramlibacter sp.]|nr:hypothetical protein [Ramlibacter sp.]
MPLNANSFTFNIRDSRILNVMQLKPQDFLVALKLVAWGEQRWTYARLAQELGISASEAHACIKRGLQAGLLLQNHAVIPPSLGNDIDTVMSAQEPMGIYRVTRKRVPVASTLGGSARSDNAVRPHSHNLAEFALYGAKYAFPGVRLPLAVGVPTAHSAPAFAGVFAPGSTDFVWPHPNGSVRGVGVEPLHPSVPFAAMQDAKLYEMLALFDALRVGKARERGMALERLEALIDPAAPRKAKGPMHG